MTTRTQRLAEITARNRLEKEWHARATARDEDAIDRDDEYGQQIRSVLASTVFEDADGNPRDPSRAELERLAARLAAEQAAEEAGRAADTAATPKIPPRTGSTRAAAAPGGVKTAESSVRAASSVRQPATPVTPASRVPAGVRQNAAVISNEVETVHKRLPIIPPRGTTITASLCTPNAFKVVMHAIQCVHAARDKGFAELETNAHALGHAIGLKSAMGRARAERLLDELQGVSFKVRSGSLYTSIVCLPTARLDHDTGTIRFKLNEDLRPYLLDLDKYSKMHPGLYKLQSTRSLLLYQHLRKFIGLQKWRKWDDRHYRVPVDKLYGVLYVEKNTPWATFHKKILQPALKEITLTELVVDYEVKRDGHRVRGGVTAVTFKVVSTLPKDYGLRDSSDDKDRVEY